MATAVANIETKTVQKEETAKVVKLELSFEEAAFISALTMRIGGSPDTSYRGISDDLGDALMKAGISAYSERFLMPGGGLECKERGL